jgi:hypothetical protein
MLKKDIYEFIDPECKSEYQSFVDKTIYRLKAEGYILTLKSGVYIVPDELDADLNSIDLIEKYYLKLLKKYIAWEVWSHYYISWLKSLQLHMRDISIPEKIYIITRSLNKKIKVWNYEIIFKTLSWKCQWKKLNLYSKFSGYHKVISIDEIEFKVSWLELSLLESALVVDMYEGVDVSLLTKTIKKYWRVFDKDIFREVGKYKYNMSYNRLKEISKTIDSELYELFLDIIKQNWWCFVWEGLRGI